MLRRCRNHTVKHLHHIVSRRDLNGKRAAQDFNLGFMQFAACLRNRIAYQNHIVIVPHSARSVVETQTVVVTPDMTHVVMPRRRRIVSSGVLEKPP